MSASRSCHAVVRSQLSELEVKLLCLQEKIVAEKKERHLMQMIECEMEAQLIALRREIVLQEQELYQMALECRYQGDLPPSCSERRHSESGESSPKAKRLKVDALLAHRQELSTKLAEASADWQWLEALRTDWEPRKRKRIAELHQAKRIEEEHLRQKKWELQAFARKYYMAPAQNVPEEILVRIFSILPLRDKLEAAKVCSKWRAAVRNPGVWKTASVDLRAAAKPDYHFIARVLKIAPYLGHVFIDRVSSHAEKLNSVPLIGRLTVNSPTRIPGKPQCLEQYKGQPYGLDLHVFNSSTAMMIDSRYSALKELTLWFEYQRPAYIFQLNMVSRSTLTILRCRDVPPATIQSIIRPHAATLQQVCITEMGKAKDCSFDCVNLALQECPLLKTVQVDCSISRLELPPSCRVVELLVLCEGPGCKACGMMSTWRGVQELRLVCPFKDPARLQLHLTRLRWTAWTLLESLERLTVRCVAGSLQKFQEQRKSFVDILGAGPASDNLRIVRATRDDHVYSSMCRR